MNIAITGASGFLGTYLVGALEEKHIQYSVFDTSKHSLFDPETLRDFVHSKDIIVHLAGVNRDGKSKDIIKVNVLGTLGLLEAITKYSPKTKLIFSSSAQAIMEDDIYGVSKKIAEELIINTAKNHPFRYTILRFSNIYGRGVKPFHNSFISTAIYQIKHNQIISIHGNGTQKRDYLHVQDAVAAILAAVDCVSRTPDPIDICTGVNTSLNKVLSILTKYSKHKIRVQYDKMVQPGKNVVPRDYIQAKKILLWQPTVSIRDGLKNLVASEKA